MKHRCRAWVFWLLLASSIPSWAQSCPGGQNTCSFGFVWRDAFPGDEVCVSGQTRQQAQQDNAQFVARNYFPSLTCRPGWVWREAGPSDIVCVDGQTRQQARADNAAGPSRREPACAAPAGSYQQTCKGIAFTNDVLSAECKDKDGFYRKRSELLRPAECRDDIANVAGYLGCNKRAVPPGSYQRACAPNIWATETLNAVCAASDAQPRRFTLNDRACVGDIFFDDVDETEDSGLRCTFAPLPAGPYQSSCRFPWVENNTLHAKCKKYRYSFPIGRYVWVPSRLNDLSSCRGEIRNIDGTLTCAVDFAMPNLVDKNLPEALGAVRAAGLLVGNLDATCAGIYESLTLVKSHSPAGNALVKAGDIVNITSCQSNQPTVQCANGRTPELYNYCVRCPSKITRDTVFSVTGPTCLSADDTKRYLEQNLYGSCTVTEGLCP